MLPLRRPPRALPSSASQMLEAKPTMTMLNMVPMQPSIRTGFLPIRSERPPQYMPMAASASEKEEMRRPA